MGEERWRAGDGAGGGLDGERMNLGEGRGGKGREAWKGKNCAKKKREEKGNNAEANETENKREKCAKKGCVKMSLRSEHVNPDFAALRSVLKRGQRYDINRSVNSSSQQLPLLSQLQLTASRSRGQ